MSSSGENSGNGRGMFSRGPEDPRFELGRKAAIEEFRNRPESETGWDRLREMYKFNKGDLTPELGVVSTGIKLSAAMGFMFGFSNQWQPGKEVFQRQFNEAKFLNSDDFMRQALRFQAAFAGRAGLRLAWRLGVFTGLYTLSTISAAIYTNQLGLKEIAASGFLAGAVYQSKVGLSGTIVGGLLGTCLGVVGGLATQQILKVNDMDFAALRYQIHSTVLEEWEEKQALKTKYLADKMIRSAQKTLEEEKRAASVAKSAES